MAILGIDPGKNGGLAYFTVNDNYKSICITPIVEDKLGWRLDVKRLCEWIRDCNKIERITVVILELVHSMPGQGVASTFSFGTIYGETRGVIRSFGIPIVQPTPQRWKHVILKDTAKDKAAAIAFVQCKHPALDLFASTRARTPHDGMADAVCLAEYGIAAGYHKMTKSQLKQSMAAFV